MLTVGRGEGPLVRAPHAPLDARAQRDVEQHVVRSLAFPLPLPLDPLLLPLPLSPPFARRLSLLPARTAAALGVIGITIGTGMDVGIDIEIGTDVDIGVDMDIGIGNLALTSGLSPLIPS